MNPDCSVYIDEAGDLGIGRGTRWFVLSAVIINAADEPEMRNIIAIIKQRLNIHDIHFRNLRNFEQKSYVVNELANGNFEFINVVIDTSQLNIRYHNPSDNPSVVTYNFACRLLIERVSWLLRDTGRIGKIVLSSRGTNRDSELIDYINNKLLNSNTMKLQIDLLAYRADKRIHGTCSSLQMFVPPLCFIDSNQINMDS